MNFSTVGELKKYIKDHNISDDNEIWIEYPKRYGLAQPEKIIEHLGEDDSDLIECLCFGHDNKILYLFHHY